MKNIRIIARLDIKGPNLVKGIHLEGLRVLGRPEDFASFYYECGVDELFYQDVVASLYERNSLGSIIENTAKRSFIPLTVGGGIRTIGDIKQALRNGADKVCINTAATKNPKFIQEASRIFGASTIVVAIEAVKQVNYGYQAFIDNGRQETGLEVIAWAKEIQDLGAGEVLITSVDRDGTGKGFDMDLIKAIVENLEIPVIVHGGCGKKEDVLAVISNAQVDAVCNASLFHYDFISRQMSSMENRTEGNVSYLKSGRTTFGSIKACDIMSTKEYLISSGVNCRV